jgi:hypothetical protein
MYWSFSRRQSAAAEAWRDLHEVRGMNWGTAHTAFMAGFHRGVNAKDREASSENPKSTDSRNEGASE